MARAIPSGYAEARFVQRALGDPDPWLCVLGIRLLGWNGTLEAAADRCRFAWESGILPGQSSTLRLQQVDLAIGREDAEPLVITSISGNAGGTSAAMLPQNCAVLVQKRSGISGRRNRGRMYIPLLAVEGGVDQYGTIDADDRLDYQNGLDAFYDALTDGVETEEDYLDPVILHSTSLGDVTPTVITKFLVEPTIATQRRRLR